MSNNSAGAGSGYHSLKSGNHQQSVYTLDGSENTSRVVAHSRCNRIKQLFTNSREQQISVIMDDEWCRRFFKTMFKQ